MQVYESGHLREMYAFLAAVSFSECTLTTVDDGYGAECLLCQVGSVRYCFTEKQVKATSSTSSSSSKSNSSGASPLVLCVVNARTSFLAAMTLGWVLEDTYSDDEAAATLVQLRAPFGFTAVLCSTDKNKSKDKKKRNKDNDNNKDNTIDTDTYIENIWVDSVLKRWHARGTDTRETSPLDYVVHAVSDLQREQRRRSIGDVLNSPKRSESAKMQVLSKHAAVVLDSTQREPKTSTSSATDILADLPSAAIVPSLSPNLPISVLEKSAAKVSVSMKTWDPLDCNLDDFQDMPLPPFYAKLRMGDKYIPMPPNSRHPIKFSNEYFDGVALLLCRTDDPASNPYRERFEGERAKRYQFEVQVQGRFLKSQDGSGFLYMGGEISKKMSLGMLSKGMCSTILKIGRAISGPGLHNSYGDKEAKELPHVGIPMWSGLDNVIVTRPPVKPGSPQVKNGDNIHYVDYLPKLGGVLAEDPQSKMSRFSAHSSAEVNLDATYTMSFKTSNIDIRRWTLSNIPLLSGTDLHSFWGDASLRTGCWLVPIPKEVPGPNVGAVLNTSQGKVQLPKYHYQSDLKYIFSIDIQHISNVNVENDSESVRMFRYMLNDGFVKTPLSRTTSLRGSLGDSESVHDASTILSQPIPPMRRRRASGVATNMVSYTNVMDKTPHVSTHNLDSIYSASIGGEEEDEFMECSPAKSPCGSDMVGLIVKKKADVNTTRKISRSGSIGSVESEVGLPDSINLSSDDEDFAEDPEVFYYDEYASNDEANIDAKSSNGSSDEEDGDQGISHRRGLDSDLDHDFHRDFEGFIDDFEEDPSTVDSPNTSEAASASAVVVSASDRNIGGVVDLDQLTMLNGSVSVIPQPVRLTNPQLRDLQRSHLLQYFYHNTHVVAVIEVDDPRFMHTQRLTIGQKGRRTMYVFAVHSFSSSGKVHTSFVLRTFQEWKSELPISPGYDTGSANSFSDNSNSFVKHWLYEKKERNVSDICALTTRCRNVNYARITDIEKRRQDLDNSYRTLLFKRHQELHAKQDAYQEALAKGVQSVSSKPSKKRDIMKALFGRSKEANQVNSEQQRQDMDTMYAPYVGVEKINAFLKSTPHELTTLLNRPAHGGGVGSKKLRAGISSFVLESYCCVQLGSFFWSQEYLGLTEEELVFIKPASRLGVSKRITLPLLALNNVRALSENELPFSLGSVKAFSVSTFSRVYLLLVKHNLRDVWIETLSRRIGHIRAGVGSNAADDHNNNNRVRHLELTVKPKGYDLETDQYVLNARSFTTGSLCAYREENNSAWPLSKLSYYLTHPHVVVEMLLKMVLRLVRASSEETEEMKDNVEKLWIDFLDGASLLQRADLSIYDRLNETDLKEQAENVENQTDSNALLCMFLNLYHVMLLHSFLVQGMPDTAQKYTYISNNCCYEAFGDCFSLSDLQSNIIQKGLLSSGEKNAYAMSNYLVPLYKSKSGTDPSHLEFCKDSSISASIGRVPAKLSRGIGNVLNLFGEYSYGASVSITDKEAYAFSLFGNKDMRLLFALNSCHSALSPYISIFMPRTLQSQLDACARTTIRRCVKVGVVVKGGGVSESSARIEDTSSGEDTVYLYGIPGMETFLKTINKMKSIYSADNDAAGSEATNGNSPARTRNDSSDYKNSDANALDLLRGMPFTGDRNFLAFILQQLQEEGGDVYMALTHAIRARHPKSPVLKTRKMQNTFHFLEEVLI